MGVTQCNQLQDSTCTMHDNQPHRIYLSIGLVLYDINVEDMTVNLNALK
jgi:hypothetical protein